MANATDKTAVFEQTLKDAGCSEALKKHCCECYEDGDWSTLETLLKQQKIALLNKVHEGQKQIDCIDYLAYTLNKDR